MQSDHGVRGFLVTEKQKFKQNVITTRFSPECSTSQTLIYAFLYVSLWHGDQCIRDIIKQMIHSSVIATVMLSHGERRASVEDLLQWLLFSMMLPVPLLVTARPKLKNCFYYYSHDFSQLLKPILRIANTTKNYCNSVSFHLWVKCERILGRVYECFLQGWKII